MYELMQRLPNSNQVGCFPICLEQIGTNMFKSLQHINIPEVLQAPQSHFC